MTNSYKYLFLCVSVGIGLLVGCDNSTTGSKGNSAASFLQSVTATNGHTEAAAYTRAIAETSDGGYMLAGMIETENQEADLYVTRLSPEGDTKWEKTFGGIPRI